MEFMEEHKSMEIAKKKELLSDILRTIKECH